MEREVTGSGDLCGVEDRAPNQESGSPGSCFAPLRPLGPGIYPPHLEKGDFYNVFHGTPRTRGSTRRTIVRGGKVLSPHPMLSSNRYLLRVTLCYVLGEGSTKVDMVLVPQWLQSYGELYRSCITIHTSVICD